MAASLKRKRSTLTKLGIDALSLVDKRVLVRVDFNVPFKKVRPLPRATRHACQFCIKRVTARALLRAVAAGAAGCHHQHAAY
jgi:hypothetical protein